MHVVLSRYFEKKKRETRRFSMRSLARQIDVSPAFLSRMLRGERAIPFKLLDSLGEALDIEPVVLHDLKDQHPRNPKKPKIRPKLGLETKPGNWDLAGPNDFGFLRQWFYLPILNITDLKNFDGRMETIAKRLGLSPITTEVAIRELLAAGLLKLKNGRLSFERRFLRWSSAKSLTEVRRFHGQMLDKAKDQLRHHTSDEELAHRLIMGVTFTASSEKIEAAKKQLNDCVYKIVDELSAEPGDEVYHLAAQLFPLTR